MAKKILLLHGWGGSDFPHWQSWLAGELAKEYGEVKFLRFSNYDTPKLSVWMLELQNALMEFTPDIVICHSLANTLWFHLCIQSSIREIEKLYLVAPPRVSCEIEELSEFFPAAIPQKLCAKESLLIVSTNDPYMSLTEAQELQQKLNIEMKVLENAGHINSDSGFGEWPWMLEEVKGKHSSNS
ncbi:MAG: alpha/beta hydrolase [Campylobacterales bacterium]|nr:alpha/beta hydrolase [Campylobacterales bacterium]